MADDKTTTFLSNKLGLLGTALGLIGSAVAIYAQLNNVQLTRQIETLKAERETRIIDNDISLKIYDKVFAIDYANAQQLRFALALTEVLPAGEFRSRLASAVSGLSSDLAHSAPEGQVRAEAELVASAAAFVAAAPPTTQSGNGNAAQGGSRSGWDYDVFWCEDTRDNVAKTRQAAAQEIAKKLAQEKSGRIRVRMLPTSINQRPGYQVYSNIIRAEQRTEESAQAQKVEKNLNEQMKNYGFTVQPSGQSTPWYLSVFVCS